MNLDAVRGILLPYSNGKTTDQIMEELRGR